MSPCARPNSPRRMRSPSALCLRGRRRTLGPASRSRRSGLRASRPSPSASGGKDPRGTEPYAASPAPSAGASAALARAAARSCAFLPGSAFCGLLRASRFIEAGGVEEAQHAVGRLRALGEPVLDLLGVERDAAGIVLRLHRIVGADLLDEAAVARASASRRRRCGSRGASWRRRGRDGFSGTFRFLPCRAISGLVLRFDHFFFPAPNGLKPPRPGRPGQLRCRRGREAAPGMAGPLAAEARRQRRQAAAAGHARHSAAHLLLHLGEHARASAGACRRRRPCPIMLPSAAPMPRLCRRPSSSSCRPSGGASSGAC